MHGEVGNITSHDNGLAVAVCKCPGQGIFHPDSQVHSLLASHFMGACQPVFDEPFLFFGCVFNAQWRKGCQAGKGCFHEESIEGQGHLFSNSGCQPSFDTAVFRGFDKENH